MEAEDDGLEGVQFGSVVSRIEGAGIDGGLGGFFDFGGVDFARGCDVLLP